MHSDFIVGLKFSIQYCKYAHFDTCESSELYSYIYQTSIFITSVQSLHSRRLLIRNDPMSFQTIHHCLIINQTRRNDDQSVVIFKHSHHTMSQNHILQQQFPKY